jgi:hypothetical protein
VNHRGAILTITPATGAITRIATRYALTPLRIPRPGRMNPGRTTPFQRNGIASIARSTR